MINTTGGASAEAALSYAQQIELIEAFERGEDQPMVLDWLQRYPHLSDDIISFMLALQVIDGPNLASDPQMDAAIERGMALGRARIHAAPAAQLDLAAALQAANLTKPQLAKQLNIGSKVVDKFVQGQILLASIPQRFLAQVAQALHATVEQVQGWAQQSTVAVSLLRRGAAQAPDAQTASDPETFAEAVRACSPKSMSEAEKAAWLKEAGE